MLPQRLYSMSDLLSILCVFLLLHTSEDHGEGDSSHAQKGRELGRKFGVSHDGGTRGDTGNMNELGVSGFGGEVDGANGSYSALDRTIHRLLQWSAWGWELQICHVLSTD